MSKKIKYLLPIRCILFILIFVLGSMLTNKELNDITNWWSIVATVANIITIIIIILVCKNRKNKSKRSNNYFFNSISFCINWHE